MSDTFSISVHVYLGNEYDQCSSCCECLNNRPMIFDGCREDSHIFCYQCLKDAIEIINNPKSKLKKRPL